MIESYAEESKPKTKTKKPAKRGRKKKKPSAEANKTASLKQTVKLRDKLIELASQSGYDYDALLGQIKHEIKI